MASNAVVAAAAAAAACNVSDIINSVHTGQRLMRVLLPCPND